MISWYKLKPSPLAVKDHRAPLRTQTRRHIVESPLGVRHETHRLAFARTVHGRGAALLKIGVADAENLVEHSMSGSILARSQAAACAS